MNLSTLVARPRIWLIFLAILGWGATTAQDIVLNEVRMDHDDDVASVDQVVTALASLRNHPTLCQLAVAFTEHEGESCLPWDDGYGDVDCFARKMRGALVGSRLSTTFCEHHDNRCRPRNPTTYFDESLDWE